MITTGSYALYKRSGHAVQIIEVKELWGITTCKVYDAADNSVFSVGIDDLTETAQAKAASEDFVRFVAAWCRVKNELANGIVFDVSESVLPLPHQRYALERAMATNDVRYMLADEVGLGKTIEAGMIIKEMKTRGLIERILVVCPKGLITQWEAEMWEKFGERFTIITPDDYGTLQKLNPDQNVFEQFTCVISPMDAIKPMDARVGWSAEKVDAYNRDRIESVVNGGWDLIIIDEAHRVAGNNSDVARHKLGTLLAKASPNLLLLTATPHSGKTEPFLRLMQLLDRSAFPNTKAVVREQVAPYLIRTEKREAVDNEGNPLFKARHTHIVEVAWESRHHLQQELYEAVTEYVRVGYNKAMREQKAYIGFLMILFQRLVSSSTEAIIDSLNRRLDVLQNQSEQLFQFDASDMAESELEETMDEALHAMSMNMQQEITHLESLLALARQARAQYMDAKAERLEELLSHLHHPDDQPKIIIFTEFIATQKALRQQCEFAGFSTTLINGNMTLEERNASLRDFRHNKDILISTDAGGEGLNLQFAHIVINFDLPWNPMKIEQRIGRADRIGQEHDVEVYNFILADTVENRVRTVLEEKLAIIFAELGIDKLQDVLDSGSAEMDFTSVYMKTIVEPQYVQSFTNAMSKDVQRQVDQAIQIRSVIHDEKTLRPDAALEQQQQAFHTILRSMLSAYYAWKHIDVDLLYDLELNVSDQRIQDLLAARQVWHPKQGIPKLSIQGLNTENGFWSLWEVSLSDDTEDKRIVSIFISENGTYRPAASKLIWDELLRGQRALTMLPDESMVDSQMAAIMRKASDVAEDVFIEMRSAYRTRHEKEYQKRKYALSLRIEAAEKIGIENIRVSRILKLETELALLTKQYEQKQTICPTFRPMLICCVR